MAADFDLTGKVAIVTGGNGGIGYGIARGLARAGASIVIAARDSAKSAQAMTALQELGVTVLSLPTDVQEESSVQTMVHAVAETLGRIDILVNNAGINIRKAPQDYTLEEWQRVLNTNLPGVFLCCRAVAPQMVKARYGRIVNIASVAGKEGNPNAVAYSASKAGVISLTKSLGKELAQTGVLVNCVTPAAAKTAIFDQMTESHIQYMLSKIPMNRFVNVEEIASLVCWLASEECSFSTGGVFDISGGRATY